MQVMIMRDINSDMIISHWFLCLVCIHLLFYLVCTAKRSNLAVLQ